MARASLAVVQVSGEPQLSGFPAGTLCGALHQTRDDPRSLKGVLATAVALGLANEVLPDIAGATLQHRFVHGLLGLAPVQTTL